MLLATEGLSSDQDGWLQLYVWGTARWEGGDVGSRVQLANPSSPLLDSLEHP